MAENDLIFWNDNVKVGDTFETTTWYRTPGLGDFVKLIMEKEEIAGVVIRPSGEETESIIGFILKEKK